MALKEWVIKTLLGGTAAAQGMRDAARDFPGPDDFVAIRVYNQTGSEPVAATEQEATKTTGAAKGVTP